MTKSKRNGSSFTKASNGKRGLDSVFLFTTGKCNQKCAMCFYANDMAKKEEDLTFEEIKKISETAPQFNKLWLSGGEPTLREDLPEIIEMFYKNNHIKDLAMPSNGMKPDRVVEWLKRIRQNCPDLNITMSISFDGFGKTHDIQRGVESFYKSAETLKKIDDNFRDDGKIIKGIATVITKYNSDEIVDFMTWTFGRFNVTTHTIEAARGVTREDGVKDSTEASLNKLQDEVAPFLELYAKRIGESTNFVGRALAKYFYIGFIRSMYNIRKANIEKPKCWEMDCTAGETTLVIDYDGRFRACELREPLGKIQDYDCDVQKILHGIDMKKEIETIGHGYKANCWCTHGCWIIASIVQNPWQMIKKLNQAIKEVKKLNKINPPPNITEDILQNLEKKYNLDTDKLKSLGIIK
ncbi:MAG: hypothetical protein Ta2F_07130 [Termitinemataceae bacterium]|nr:MAG: hypothetical protein Ta2F_07130 [Termitinemataceae bacterium]